MENTKEIKGIRGLTEVVDDTTLYSGGSSSGSSKEAVIETTLKHFLSTDDIDMKARIKNRQILPLSKLLVYEKVFNISLAGDFARQMLRLSISESGSGRKELTEIVRGLPSEVPQPFDPLSLKSSLFGK